MVRVRRRRAAAAAAGGGGRHGARSRHRVRVPTARVHGRRVRVVRVLRRARRAPGHVPGRKAQGFPPLSRRAAVRTGDRSRLHRVRGRPAPRRRPTVAADVRRQPSRAPPAQEDQIGRATVTAVMMMRRTFPPPSTVFREPRGTAVSALFSGRFSSEAR